MTLIHPRVRLFLVTALIVAAVLTILSWSDSHQPARMLRPSQVLASRPSDTVTLEGIVLNSTSTSGRVRIRVADPAAPEVGVLWLEYSGPQRVTFGRGTVVIAHGHMRRSDVFDVFEVEDFVLKGPRRLYES